MVYSADYLSPVGRLMIVSDGNNITGLWMYGQKYFPAFTPEDITVNPELPVLKAAFNWLDRYFAGKNPSVSELPLAPEGGAFRRAVWDVLKEIPYGSYITYGETAKRAALKLNKTKMSNRAVGGAVGRNPVSIIIPCHRVVGANGSLTGFSGGIDKKIKLLRHEGADISRLFAPSKGSAL